MTENDLILVPTDFSEGAARALREAGRIAEKTRAGVYLLHVPDPDGDPNVPELLDGLRALATELVPSDVQVAEVVHADADASAAILRFAHRHGAELIVCGTHGRTGVRRLVLGSVAERLVTGAACPVLTVRPMPVADQVTSVIVAVDFSEWSEDAVRLGRWAAGLYGAPLSLLHVVEPAALPVSLTELKTNSDIRPELTRRYEAELLALAKGRVGVDKPGIVVLFGDPGPEIVAASEAGGVLLVLLRRQKSVVDRLLEYGTLKQVLRRGPDRVLTYTRPTGASSGPGEQNMARDRATEVWS